MFYNDTLYDLLVVIVLTVSVPIQIALSTPYKYGNMTRVLCRSKCNRMHGAN